MAQGFRKNKSIFLSKIRIFLKLKKPLFLFGIRGFFKFFPNGSAQNFFKNKVNLAGIKGRIEQIL